MYFLFFIIAPGDISSKMKLPKHYRLNQPPLLATTSPESRQPSKAQVKLKIELLLIMILKYSFVVEKPWKFDAAELVLLNFIDLLHQNWLLVHYQGCELNSNGDFFSKNLGNWSPNGLLLRSKSPYHLKFLAFHKKSNKI